MTNVLVALLSLTAVDAMRIPHVVSRRAAIGAAVAAALPLAPALALSTEVLDKDQVRARGSTRTLADAGAARCSLLTCAPCALRRLSSPSSLAKPK